MMAAQGIRLPTPRVRRLAPRQSITVVPRPGRVRHLRMRKIAPETGTEMAGLGLPGYDQNAAPKPAVDFSFNLSPEAQAQVVEEIRTGSAPTIGPAAPATAQPSFWQKLSTGFQSFATAVTPVATSVLQYKAATDAKDLAERQAREAALQAEHDRQVALALAQRPVSTTPKWLVPAALVGAGLLVITLVAMKKK